jgi:hypothetical protein
LEEAYFEIEYSSKSPGVIGASKYKASSFNQLEGFNSPSQNLIANCELRIANWFKALHIKFNANPSMCGMVLAFLSADIALALISSSLARSLDLMLYKRHQFFKLPPNQRNLPI